MLTRAEFPDLNYTVFTSLIVKAENTQTKLPYRFIRNHPIPQQVSVYSELVKIRTFSIVVVRKNYHLVG